MPFKSVETNRIYQREWRRKFNFSQRKKAIESLGGKCQKCGNVDSRVLQIDHINPTLTKDKKSGNLIVRNILLKKESLTNLQILCANCHAIKTLEDRIKFKCWKGESGSKI